MSDNDTTNNVLGMRSSSTTNRSLVGSSSSSSSFNYKAGDVVRTQYGVGVIVNVFAATLAAAGNDTNVSACPLETSSSATSIENHRTVVVVEKVIVRLWRIPGKSIASSALAFLNPNSILGRVPVAPGMTTYLRKDTTKLSQSSLKDSSTTSQTSLGNEVGTKIEEAPRTNGTKVLIHCYLESQNMYIASIVSEDDDISKKDNTAGNINNNNTRTPIQSLIEVHVHELMNAPSAKVYPVLESLMNRAEQTAAVVTNQLRQLKTTQKVVSKAGRVLQEKIHEKTSSFAATTTGHDNAVGDVSVMKSTASETISESTKYIEQIATKVETETIPALENNIKEVLAIVKDEEITVLLQKCKDRLEQLQNNIFESAARYDNNSEGQEGGGAAGTGTLLSSKTIESLEKTAGIKLNLSMDEDDDNDHERDNNENDDGNCTTKVGNDAVKSTATIPKSIRRSRKMALGAIRKLLQQATVGAVDEIIDGNDRKAVRDEIITNFTAAFDSLQVAAKSDKVISELFQGVSSKTTEWQKHTGRLLQTKSASLFMESASRLQSRAAAILGNNTINNNNGRNSTNPSAAVTAVWNDIATKFTKSFTEGDAAIARLKSIELGQAIKDKLIRAIEVRSESQGGLDGIIAGALANVVKTGKHAVVGASTSTTKMLNSNDSGMDDIQNLLSTLQQAATSAASNAHETLISVLSSQSRYRDLALIRIENALCDLLLLESDDDEVGNKGNAETSGVDCNDSTHKEIDIDPERLAAIVQGEGGTAQIFAPIAKRAMKQIEQQLDAAELYILNSNKSNNKNKGDGDSSALMLLDGLKRIRKLLSGELSVSAIMDELVGLLNDDKVVAVGETLMQHGERVLDALEGGAATLNGFGTGNGSGNKVVAEALQIAERAGITKDTVMKELDQLNVNELIGTAEQAVTDERARQQLISSATDAALDFLLKILPSMPVPPFEGVKDGLLYHISNLSMQGFKVCKEDIQIDLAGIRATKTIKKQRATREGFERGNIDDISSTSNNTDNNSSGATNDSVDHDQRYNTVSNSSLPIKATELLIIDIQGISAILDNAIWSFEQTYMPYLKRNGAADIRMAGGSIRLQFELRKQRKPKQQPEDTKKTGPNDGSTGMPSKPSDDDGWEPVLCLHDRFCSIAEVDLTLSGEGRLTWILNKLVSIFKGPLRDYVVRTIISLLSNQSGWILKRLNTILSPYWDLILRTAKLSMDDLLEADDQVIVSEEEAPGRKRIELVWRERLPLGMNLLMNDESGLLKVADFPRGSAARVVCDKRNLDPDLFKGATISAVNGTKYSDQNELFDALKDPSRPKAIQFELADSEEVKRLLEFLEGPTTSLTNAEKSLPEERSFGFRRVEFTQPGQLGIEFGSSVDNACLVVNGFLEGDGGIVLAAAKQGNVNVGDILTHVNDVFVVGLMDGEDGRTKAIQLLESAATHRPLTLTFCESYIHRIAIQKQPSHSGIDNEGGPAELVLNEREVCGVRRIYIEKFVDTAGVAESSGILIGDHLVFVNGFPVGIGCQWLGSPDPPSFDEVFAMLSDRKNYPIGLTLARPLQQQTTAKKNRSWTGNISTSLSGSNASKNDTLRDSDADTRSVMAESYDRIGCVFSPQVNKSNPQYIDIVVADFLAVPGIFQRSIMSTANQKNYTPITRHATTSSGTSPLKKMSIESINGNFVPSYATVDIVKNALNRSWKDVSSLSTNDLDPALEMVLCDDDLKEWLKSKATNTVH